MDIVPYTEQCAEIWNHLVNDSRNGTFLFDRRFMDYHSDRFCDVSLMFFRGDRLLGVLPASRHDECVVSHGGLTYGGFVLSPLAHAADVGEMLELAILYFRERRVKEIIIKPIPAIYHSQPSDDELYWLFRQGATLSSRGLSSAIRLSSPLPFSTLRSRKVRQAQRAGVMVDVTTSLDDYARFWEILTQVLHVQHHKAPVHSLDEILLLQKRFQEQIRLFVARRAGDNAILGGTLLFITQKVVHAQYIAASDEGRSCGALDFLFHFLVAHYSSPFSSSAPSSSPIFFDFGISTENDGMYLNEGLNFQKEGFGARSVVYDAYKLTL